MDFSNFSLEEALSLRKKARVALDLGDAYITLAEVFEVCTSNLIEHPDSQFWRRTSIRSFFASVELLTYTIKHMLLVYQDINHISLSSSEIAVLKEERYVLQNNGKVDVKRDKLPTKPNILFAFRTFHAKMQLKGGFEVTGKGWKAFQDALNIRHRITHPKSSSDIAVTDVDVQVSAVAMVFIAEAGKVVTEKINEMGEAIYAEAVKFAS